MIVGFTGRMQSGKDTAADFLLHEHDYYRASFAQALREEVDKYFGDLPLYIAALMPLGVLGAFNSMKREDIWRKPTTRAARIVLQWWGTEFRRNRNPEYWVRKLLYSMTPGVDYAISDVRFQNEAEIIRDLGGIVIKIERDAADKPGEGIQGHASEKLDFDVDHVIQNNGSFEDLYEKIETCLNLSKNCSPSTRPSSSPSSELSGAQLALLL